MNVYTLMLPSPSPRVTLWSSFPLITRGLICSLHSLLFSSSPSVPLMQMDTSTLATIHDIQHTGVTAAQRVPPAGFPWPTYGPSSGGNGNRVPACMVETQHRDENVGVTKRNTRVRKDTRAYRMQAYLNTKYKYAHRPNHLSTHVPIHRSTHPCTQKDRFIHEHVHTCIHTMLT